MKRLRTRLQDQRRDDVRPTPVWIWYDGRGMTSTEALAAAIASGQVPARAAIVLLPQDATSHEQWTRDAQAEYVARERQRAALAQQATQTGTKPAGSNP